MELERNLNGLNSWLKGFNLFNQFYDKIILFYDLHSDLNAIKSTFND